MADLPLALGAIHLSHAGALRLTDREAWRRRVMAALATHGGNRTRTARELGITYRTLRRWLVELEIPVLGAGGRPRVAAPAGGTMHGVHNSDAHVIAKTPRKRPIRGKA